MIRALLNSTLLVASLNASLALADVYGYEDQDGVINLTDTQVNDSYRLLAVAPVQQVGVAIPVGGVDTDDYSQDHLSQNIRYKNEVKAAAKNSGVEAALIHAVIAVESNYNSKAISVKGAAGLMQLMPTTAKRFGVIDSYDPRQNIQAGASYLAYLLKLFNNDLVLAVAAYNAGELSVIKHGNAVPPYKETIEYVSRVMLRYKKFRFA